MKTRENPNKAIAENLLLRCDEILNHLQRITEASFNLSFPDWGLHGDEVATQSALLREGVRKMKIELSRYVIPLNVGGPGVDI